MLGRFRSWAVGGHGEAARGIHSADRLQCMYRILTENTTVTDHNRKLLVETIRSITEILIWGDQNGSSVFDFFLEKNMFVFFVNILRQKPGHDVCVQLLQTLNILFETISHEKSLYYLLSNSFVNSIIVHEFDFSDEDIVAYYISFLKTLSLKLNNHTVRFFYNKHKKDFPLYTEAIKFFNHPESMVRIAVRTITLNVYKVDNQPMRHYIRARTAVPYFSNLVGFIGSRMIELDNCVRTDEEHRNRGKLSDLVAEHLDHLHYLNDILINCEFLNDVLTDHLLNRLFLPLSASSLTHSFMVFLIIHYAPLVNPLAEFILTGKLTTFYFKLGQDIQKHSAKSRIRCFTKPTETLERSREVNKQKGKKRVQKRPNYKNVGEDKEERQSEDSQHDLDKTKSTEASSKGSRASRESEVFPLNRPFLDMVYNALDCAEDDYHALLVLCLLYAMSHNKGIDPVKLETVQLPAQHGEERSSYNHILAEGLIRILNYAAQPDGRIRLATLELGCLLLKQLVFSKNGSIMKDVHLECLEGEVFLDMFEDEYWSMTIKPMNVENLMMDASILLPPTGTPLTGIDFVKRLPCGDVERTRRAIRVFLMLRSLTLHLHDKPETQLPLTREEDLIKTDDVLDLNNRDLIACAVITKDGGQVQRFLALDIYQMSLVEPDAARLGWGVVKFAGLLQDMEVTGVEGDSRALNIVIHKPASSPHSEPFPTLEATLVFSDRIHCLIAKQHLAEGRIQARQMKMQRIAGFTVAQHHPFPLSSPSPSSSSGSTGRYDSMAVSKTSTPSIAQYPPAPEQPHTTVSGQMMLTDESLLAVSKSSKNAVNNSDIETANLSPSHSIINIR
ncbi:hypothetical protein ASZ78_005734 [Callipepla squamata]|uniref:Uncharacterized protein n=1 Tax=Callipepla squamata TaxID=9009 RepID=A0A226NIM1_CALSU|nr:hypothetical protein ASZ78_005734 [Callipepla squamata]